MDLFSLVREIKLIEQIGSLLSWDRETYLPSGAADYRATQLSYLAAKAHKLRTSPEYLAALATAEDTDPQTHPVHTANLRELRRESDLSNRIPTDLVAAESTAQSLAHHAWIDARKASDFSIFAPHLEALFEFARKKSDLWGYEDEPYSALLQHFERNTSATEIAAWFEDLRETLAPVSAAAVETSAARRLCLPAGPYPVEQQQAFNALVAAEIGFDFRAGRIDTTTHPFCTGLGPKDTRITTRYDVNDFTSSLFGIMHEVGHALYEQGLPDEDFGLPSGSSVSLGIHESQSRLWENQVGRSPDFWQKFYPIAQGFFSPLRHFPLESFMNHIHRAEFSPIRVEADEVTYDLHIILRFRIERMILNREISIAEVPATWCELFRQSFGFAPADDAHGCLQDIHWSMGGIGYFPTYTLGNIHAAQLFKAAISDPHVRSSARQADYAPLLTWLRQNIHQHGAVHDPADLIQLATGKKPDTGDYIAHLKSRYLDQRS
jgi:carboxypeptidase Taq